MKDKYLLKAIKEEKLLDKFKDYKEMTREEIEYQLGWGDTNEFSWGFAIYLLNNIDKAIEYIDNLREESAERQDFSYCYPDDLYIPNIENLLNILKGGK